uniref:Uncharacterized protein n=1 Tax=Trichogramma kaykai TaxID=54128 RepID=A0ABD2X6C3_9HYME
MQVETRRQKSEKPPPLPHRVLHISTVLGAYEQQPPRHPIASTFMRAHVLTPGMADAATIYVTCYRYGARCFTTPPRYLSFCTTHTLRMLYSHIINCVRNMHNKAKMRLGHENARRLYSRHMDARCLRGEPRFGAGHRNRQGGPIIIVIYIFMRALYIGCSSVKHELRGADLRRCTLSCTTCMYCRHSTTYVGHGAEAPANQ